MIRRLREQRIKTNSSISDNCQNLNNKEVTKDTFKTPIVHPAPVLSTRDRGHTDLQESVLYGEKIPGFSIGGEMRLCLPVIFNLILDRFVLQAINVACDELRVHCSYCSADQLRVLKEFNIVPLSTVQCGLITRSDAERLCSYLLDRNPPRASVNGFNARTSPFSFRVQHECFGKCVGILLPEACTGVDAPCIECLTCEGIFSPQKFVCHTHSNAESRTCHWGFDSANWRSYLHLWEDYTEAEKEKLEKQFQGFKNRFLTLAAAASSSNGHNIKRKQVGIKLNKNIGNITIYDLET